jgi:hypothetical protein
MGIAVQGCGRVYLAKLLGAVPVFLSDQVENSSNNISNCKLYKRIKDMTK